MKNNMTKWENEKGVKFLKKIGIRTGQTVLDFGAGIGHYSIPAAIAVGKTGTIYALDKDRERLEELKRKAKHLNLNNIKIIHTTESVTFTFEAESIDTVLLYDVLHYFNLNERVKLYSEVFRVLRPEGIFSVYPKHILEDCPLDKFSQLSLDDLIQEIVNANFKFQRKYCGMISHNNSLNRGCILNFSK
jgi:ubiquinone/menaquinone biosynthesis C-methylase UbiE